VSHGGGPSFFLPATGRFADIGSGSGTMKTLQDIPRQLGLLGERKPKALVLISAHWESSGIIQIAAKPKYDELFYDYYGFPDETYQLQYTAPGSVEVAKRVDSLLRSANIPSKLNTERNWDHGLFIPLKVMFPAADIPCVEMSIDSSLDPAFHIALGKALQPLRDEGVLIIGSGFITHNFQPSEAGSKAFVNAIKPLLITATPSEREKGLIEWSKLPGARASHNREEHLIPLHVVAGAAGEDHGKMLAEMWIMGGAWCFAHVAFGQFE